jgi:hypothetical protein
VVASSRYVSRNRASGPLFTLIRGASSCAWTARADVPQELGAELERLASEEPPIQDPQAAPVHADTYVSLMRGQIVSGPAFAFPDGIAHLTDVRLVDNLQLLERSFGGWTAVELPERSPILAVMDGGYPVSICFCARSSEIAAEAGVETATACGGGVLPLAYPRPGQWRFELPVGSRYTG